MNKNLTQINKYVRILKYKIKDKKYNLINKC